AHEMIAKPCEPVDALDPVHPELERDLLLADLPLSRLDELDHAHPPAPRDAAHHHPERGRRLTLPIAGVHQHERASAGVRRVCRPLARGLRRVARAATHRTPTSALTKPRQSTVAIRLLPAEPVQPWTMRALTDDLRD